MADFITELRINGIPCRMRIRGAQEQSYSIKIKVCEFQTAETMNLIMFGPGLLSELAGIANRNMWSAAGPFDPLFRQSLLGTIERNYRQEMTPSDSDPEDLDEMMRNLVDYYVEPVIDELLEANFPKDAVPVFRQFAR